MKTKIFKKAIFGGFDRADVMQYISELQAENSAALRESEDKAALAQKRADELSKEIEKAAAEAVDLKEKADYFSKQAEELSEKNRALSDVNTELTDEISHQVGKIFTQARINAQSIIDEAKEKAEQIEKNSRRIFSEAQNGLAVSKSTVGDAKKEVESILDEVIEKLNLVFDSLEANADPDDGKDISSVGADIPAPKKIPVKISKHSPIRKVD